MHDVVKKCNLGDTRLQGRHHGGDIAVCCVEVLSNVLRLEMPCTVGSTARFLSNRDLVVRVRVTVVIA
jgi:hypothetical protein